MKVLQFRECPDCGRMAPYMQTICGCGHRFTGKERLYKTCPHCGSLNPATRILCDCGHVVLFSRSKLTAADIENAYNSGRIDGMMEERKHSGGVPQGKEPVYMLEDKDGFLVRVPKSKLSDWEKAQSGPSAPLTEAERRLSEKIMERIYGPREKEGRDEEIL